MSRPSQPELPGRRGYQLVTEELSRRWRAAETRALMSARAEDREAGEAELDALWAEIRAHEDEGNDRAAEEQWERDHGGER